MNKSKIYIGMPVKNGEKHIADAINSILSQTYINWELNIFDNNSSDGTRCICEEYVQKDSRIKYHKNIVDLGAASNFNQIASMSCYEYFMWFACDDIISKNFLSECVKVLDKNQKISMAFTRIKNINSKGKVIREYPEIFKLSEEQHWLAGLKYIFAKEIMGKANIIYSLMRTKLIQDYYIKHKLESSWGSDMAFISGLVQRSGLHISKNATFYKRVSTLMKKRQYENQFQNPINFIPFSSLFDYFSQYLRNIHFFTLLPVIIVVSAFRATETIWHIINHIISSINTKI